jgi:hypothetical protein
MKIIMNPDGTVSFEEEERPVLEPIDFNYKEDDIKQSLIEECEELSIKNNKTYFIFDDMISNRIKTNNQPTSELLRNEKLNLLLEDDDSYHIGTEDDFRGLPSRFSYYDTETKLIGRYRRYDFVTAYLTKIGFVAQITNLGPEYEQSYLIELVDEKFICRLRPNLFLKIIYQNLECEQKTIFEGFFKKTEIFEIMKNVAGASFARDLKLSQILE